MRNTTKMKFKALNFALLFLVTFSFAQNNPMHFKSDLDFGNGMVFSTFLDVTMAKNEFAITSPKNADVRIFGGKAKLGRALGKSPKKGIIITISGQQQKDSLFGVANIPMVGKIKFKGVVNNETLSGAFLNDEAMQIGTVQGINSLENKIDYNYLYPIVLKTIQDNIYSTSVLQTEAWKNFDKKIEKLCATAHDDIELFFGFNILNQELPFSHLNLYITQEETTDDEEVSTSKTVVFEEKNENTVYLQIKNFSSSTAELAAILPKIVQNEKYKNLIIDLRNNPGGGIEAAFEFAKHITDTDMEVGYFLTNKLQYSGYEPEVFKTLPKLQPKGTKEFTDQLQTTSGAKLIFTKPNNAVFAGKIYILTNGKTGSTCEPIVYSLKNSKRATIVGEKTAGAMLAACPFVVAGKYSIALPIADFYTYDGVRLDKVGVQPDNAVASDDALNKALEMITNSTN